tara:strand:+ start:262 stop:666 length:405 start_codon:yes stop_codon:yes gene_type:complete
MDLSSSKFFQYLGCALVILIVFYIVMSLCNYQLKLVETLTNMSSDSVNTAATIKESTTKTLDTLLIDKYRSNYEDIIINMNDWCDAQMLKTIVSGEMDCKNGCDDKFMKKIQTVNDLGSFKGYLNKSMGFLDKQ